MAKIANIIAGALLVGAAPVRAQGPQPTPILASADAPFVHANSGMTLPPALAGMTRTQVREFEAPQLDIVGNWFRDGDAAELSVYVFRSTAGSVPIWFDRAAWAIEMRGTYGTPAPAGPPVAIRAPGAPTDSGLIAGWTVSTGPYTGTAVAILPVGDWLVKLRYSAKDGDGAAAVAVLKAAIAGLGWPRTIASAPVAAPIAGCTTPIAYPADAASLPPDPNAMLTSAIAGLAAAKATSATIAWCRDDASIPMGAVYRPGGATDAYFIALSDAGRGIQVGPSVASQVTAEIEKTPRIVSWSVDLVLPGRTLNYPLQDKLPSPVRVLQLLQGPPMASATTWGDKPGITLPSTFGRK